MSTTSLSPPRRLGARGVKLLIEPINTRDMPGFFLNRTDEALRLIERVRSDNLWLQADVYHMQVMEGDLARGSKRRRPHRPHPDRRQSGTP